MFRNKFFAIIAILFCLTFNANEFTQAQELTKYPDYAYAYLGVDKFENFNRKMSVFNSKLNKCVIRPVHVVWSSVMPKYGMDRLQSAYSNMEYPQKLVSSLLQKDFKTAKNETIRFATNTTIGIGGLYDPAEKIFKIAPANEDMEQALAKCKVKQGNYVVLPVLMSSTPRALAGKVLDIALQPTTYIGSPIAALVKFGLMVNKTAYMQPLAKMLESTYADPYDIAKKLYGIETHIKISNLDRKETFQEMVENTVENSIVNNPNDVPLLNNEEQNIEEKPIKQDKVVINDTATVFKTPIENDLQADLNLSGYNPQNPVVDAMRTALFDLPEINKSMWSDLSIWNHSFAQQVKTSSVNIAKGRDDYKFRYILQKNKNAPVAIIYPSIGEGVMSYHSVVLAKLFYDAGYSAIIQGSHFQWEFVKSMPADYRPGMPSADAQQLKVVTSKILNSLEEKNNCQFSEKVVIGTSFGALTTLFLADSEYKENTMNITKYISINPPIDLMYAMKQMDKNSEEWSQHPSDIKNRVAITAAKVIQVAQLKNDSAQNIKSLPFSEEEAKLITGFIMHQKLSDVIFTLENGSKSSKTDIYKSIDNMNYSDYTQKYFANNTSDLAYSTTLYSIESFLKNNNNYRIYHTLDDYLVNPQQLKQLKKYSGNKAVFISNGSHLGFLYRQEFIDALKKDIAIKEITKESRI